MCYCDTSLPKLCKLTKAKKEKQKQKKKTKLYSFYALSTNITHLANENKTYYGRKSKLNLLLQTKNKQRTKFYKILPFPSAF